MECRCKAAVGVGAKGDVVSHFHESLSVFSNNNYTNVEGEGGDVHCTCIYL